MKKQNIQNIFSYILKNAIYISYEKSQTDILIGNSKIGGKPHLPKTFTWPYFEGNSYGEPIANRPLAFLAQINLSEITLFDRDNLLPPKGILYFFYEIASMTWGFDPLDKGAAKVFYYDVKPDDLIETDFPNDLHNDYIIPQQQLTFQTGTDLPSFGEYSMHYDRKKDWDTYDEERSQFGCPPEDSPEERIKLLGYADIIQDDMLQECEMATSGIYCGNGWPSLSKKEQMAMDEQSKDWILLFQMGTVHNEDYELMWGDCGCIYFYIKRKDLEKKNFDDIWMILQCG